MCDVSATASLAENGKLLAQVIPKGQNFQRDNNYCGIFRFRFWRFGQWVEVVVRIKFYLYFFQIFM